MKRWVVASLAGVGVFAATFVVFGVPTWLTWRAEKALERSAVQTEAIITHLRPHDHGTCSYTFEVGDKRFTGLGRGCSTEQVGQRIGIYYAGDDPENSSNETPGSWRFPYVWLFWMLVVMPGFAAFGVLQARKTPDLGE
ncbi:hypothetical protein ABAC460_20510 [Asticcacaulis sp. AC460]|uniref:DUF3592 domain-containing protein n=1 Tax=Asticcacaulis sp. AC460 TaxID=1282360 RepID=UPI0003C3CFB8|nr:DUF3592 domain-containing protein [Asticcacaulis sp. AC460]ESQ87156.1 hypothetical protein ABAC460_20510 [Asticcacaulis sp. AC460]